jgi:hypothetical protein
MVRILPSYSKFFCKLTFLATFSENRTQQAEFCPSNEENTSILSFEDDPVEVLSAQRSNFSRMDSSISEVEATPEKPPAKIQKKHDRVTSSKTPWIRNSLKPGSSEPSTKCSNKTLSGAKLPDNLGATSKYLQTMKITAKDSSVRTQTAVSKVALDRLFTGNKRVRSPTATMSMSNLPSIIDDAEDPQKIIKDLELKLKESKKEAAEIVEQLRNKVEQSKEFEGKVATLQKSIDEMTSKLMTKKNLKERVKAELAQYKRALEKSDKEKLIEVETQLMTRDSQLATLKQELNTLYVENVSTINVD